MTNLSPEFALAWLATKKEMEPVVKKARNNFFKTGDGKPSQYATLAQVLEEADTACQNNKIILSLEDTNSEDGKSYGARIHLIYAPLGEHYYGPFLLLSPAKNDPQGGVAACTYSERKVLTGFFALPTLDDDGNTASKPAPIVPKITEKGVEIITSLMKEVGVTDGLTEVFSRLKIKPVLIDALSVEDAKKVIEDLKVKKATKN